MTHQIAEADQDRVLGAPPAGEPAEDQRTAERDELHHQDRRDEDRSGECPSSSEPKTEAEAMTVWMPSLKKR